MADTSTSHEAAAAPQVCFVWRLQAVEPLFLSCLPHAAVAGVRLRWFLEHAGVAAAVLVLIQAANPFAALGSTGAAFGTAGGAFSFGVPTAAFGASAAPKPAEAEDGEGGEEDGAAVAEEECQAEFKPIVQLDEVETKSGEEDEDSLLEL
jgi:hypothetical protein